MKKISILLFGILLFFVTGLSAKTWKVYNIKELQQADQAAQPGDLILLQAGEWKNISIQLTAKGTEQAPIIYKVSIPGEVQITGQSSLSIGGEWLVIDGWFFTNGNAGNKSVISFRTKLTQLANHCRVTNCVIDSYTTPKRLVENYWVELQGKQNRLDHCTFLNKQNMGVVIAVVLENEQSRNNFHSIDHNNFGYRIPLASNTGEIIRVGVSEQCEFNSNTLIANNAFTNCDGEAEIISIKSGANIIRGNLFTSCQGAVVLRHGNNNKVIENVFLGNNKAGTGGVRIINEGNWIVNNYFYQCRGEGFRAPLCIMNGVPNSPAIRYLPVTNALVANNTFIDCAPMSFGEGSDKERSQAPNKVVVLNNLFANKKDSLLFRAYDKTDGFIFAGNLTNHSGKQLLPKGIRSTSFRFTASDSIVSPAHPLVNPKPWQDSIIQNAPDASNLSIQANPGILSIKKLQEIKSLANTGTGAKWFKPTPNNPIHKQVSCINGTELYQQINAQTSEKLTILLTGTNYEIPQPIHIKGNLTLTAKHTDTIRFSIASIGAPFVFQIMAGSSLTLSNLIVNLQKSTANAWIATDSSGNYKHSWFRITNCSIIQNHASFFYAYKTSVTDSIVFSNNRFFMGSGIILNLQQENERKGLYPVEHLTLTNNQFEQFAGQILSIARPGVDESTLGPMVTIRNNQFKQIETTNNLPLIHFSGAQKTYLINNQFIRCNPDKTVVLYQDEVKAEHRMERNILEGSGKIITNKYLVSTH